MRMTKNRKLILNIIKESNKPLSAELIIEKLDKGIMDPATVYRSLDVLYNNNYLIKSTLNQISYYHLNSDDHNHYMLCLSCNKLFKVECHLDSLESELEQKNNLKIVSHNLTFYGYCEKCRN